MIERDVPTHRTEDEWIKVYQSKGALWIHDSNPRRPHALLTSTKHSDGFFKSRLVAEDPSLLDQATEDLRYLLVAAGLDTVGVDRVVGPAMGAITLAHDVARHISQRRGNRCLASYVEKQVIEVEGITKTIMRFTETSIERNERILLVEDVLTTGGSVDSAAEAIAAVGGIVMPYVGVLVNRSGLKEVSGKKIVALIDRSMSTWDASECPLCKKGSRPLKPKAVDNWTWLTQPYA